MAGQAEKLEQGLEQVLERLQTLEKRVAVLEGLKNLPASTTVESYLGVSPKEKAKPAGSTSVVPVLGKAVLAIAGAYLLRAIAESGALPRWMMLVAGILYAAGWLVWAKRSHRKSHFASVIFALTATMILPPLLWEGTVRFQDLTASFASAILVGMVALSFGLAWKENLVAIPWIGTVTAVGTAIVLIIATHELRALTVGLLAMALITEVAACYGGWLNLRVVTALASDFAVSLLGLVMTSTDGVPASYRAMSGGEVNAFCIALMVIYGGGTAIRAVVMERELTFAELLQSAVAFVLGTWISLRATHGTSAEGFGVVFLVLAIGCYWGTLKKFASIAARRNQRASASYAACLVLGGSVLLLNGDFRVLALSGAAVATLVVFRQTKRLSLGIHVMLYLLAAGLICGMFKHMANAMAGTVPAWPTWSLWVTAVSGLTIYLLGSRGAGERWKERVLWLVPAAIVGSMVAAMAVEAAARLSMGEISASRLSMVRTVVTCAMALGLGYAGSRWNRSELGWLAYGAVGLGALKLVAEDLRFGNAGTLMVSLLFYGLILVLLPKLTRFGRVEV
jgi:hypothetical protein